MRPTLLYASPLPPERSGVALYSEVLLEGLAGIFDVTLVSRQRRPRLRGAAARLPVLRHGIDPVEPARFDHVLYNIGNQPEFHGYIVDLLMVHPGPVILHDVVLYYLTVGLHEARGDLYSKVYELAGAAGVRILREERRSGRPLLQYREPGRLPLNHEVLRHATLTVVHSEHARRQIARGGSGTAVSVIPMVDPSPVLETQHAGGGPADELLGVSPDVPLVASFGMIAPTKQNRLVCRAIDRVSELDGGAPVYVMVGEGHDADDCLGPRVRKTGFVDDASYGALLERCDLVVNLRYPTMGETSITLIHAMSRGKACVVTDDAWFAELPEEVVVHVAPDVDARALADVLQELLADPARRAALGRRAREYVRDRHRHDRVARRLFSLLEGQVSGPRRPPSSR